MRRSLRLAVAAIVVLVLMVLLPVAGYVGLIFGWHPIPSTALGCSLHKRFHSFSGSPVTKSENLGLATDCLKVTTSGREGIVRDPRKIAAVRAWLDSRSDLWVENFLNAPDQNKPLIVIRACNQPPGTSETYVYWTKIGLASIRARGTSDPSAVANGGRWRRSSRAPNRDVTPRYGEACRQQGSIRSAVGRTPRQARRQPAFLRQLRASKM